MSHLQIFSNQEFGAVRCVEVDGKPYAVGVDVARALGYTKPSQAIIDHCKGIRKLGIPSDGGVQETNIIPEGDIYRLIVKAADQSKNDEIKARAEKFERWVFDEVIPSIRKTGSYIAPSSPTEALLQAVQILAQQEKQIKALVAATEVLNHRIDNMDVLDTIGDLQQRLNAMIRKLAQQQGLSFSGAWKTFRGAYNLAFRTNLTMLVENYKMRHGISKITVPQYLNKVGKLEDAIRVADKLLNRTREDAEHAQSL